MSSVNNTINELNQATAMIVLVFSSISIVPGGIGLLFNVFIFTRASLRREPCAVYFFWSSCVSLITVFVIQPVRVVAVSFNLDAANYNAGICRTQLFTLYDTRSISVWLIVMACTDRFFHSSADARVRRLSSLKTARMTVAIVSAVIFVGHVHMIVYHEINIGRDRFGQLTGLCNPQKGVYATFLPFWNIIFYSLAPSSLMLLFGVLTLRHLRQRRLVLPTGIETAQIVRRTDTQLLRMLTAQVFVIIIFTLPVSINQLYLSFTSGITKDTLRIAQENVASRFFGIIPYFAHSSTFYLYTLTGTVFRKEFLKIFRRCYHSNQPALQSIRDQTHPMSLMQKAPRAMPTLHLSGQDNHFT